MTWKEKRMKRGGTEFKSSFGGFRYILWQQVEIRTNLLISSADQ